MANSSADDEAPGGNEVNGMLKMVRSEGASAVEALEAEVAQLSRQADALAVEIERLATVEDEAEEAGEVANAMGATRAARNRMRKLDSKIDAVCARLAMAKDARRVKHRDALIAEYRAASHEFLTAAHKAQEAFARAIAAREELQGAGFRVEHAALPIPPGIAGNALLAPDLLDRFAMDLDPRPRFAIAPVLRTAAVSARTTAKRGDAAPSSGGRVYLRQEPQTTDAHRRPLRAESQKAGEVLVTVLRSGLELPDGASSIIGDIVSMSEAKAMAIVRAGAADFVAAPDKAPPDVSGALRLEAAE